MRRIAVYGKGGIGKSTISSNLSAALALAGSRVVQVGCDPKHDSTRQLLGGERITTVLDYLRNTKPVDYCIEAVLHRGFAGVGCVEAGGPKPGVGCAGRGIISTFDLLARFKLESRYDTVVYDVLGDVVCGGFAVPIRREYADTVLVVTSGEFMSLYAANNILRGIRSYDGEELARVAGIVFNRRNVTGEDERVQAFAQAVGLPVFADIPRSDAFARAEREHVTVVQLGDEAALSALFDDMARRLIQGVPLHVAQSLSDEELERVVLGGAGKADAAHAPQPSMSKAVVNPTDAGKADEAGVAPIDPIDLTDPNRYLSKSLAAGEPLHGCAFNGAVSAALNVRDAVVVAHAPRSCANLALATFSSAGRRVLFERGELMPASLAPNLACTDMDESQIVFGGTQALFEKVRAVQGKEPRPHAAIVISSCPAGIIGDDLDAVAGLSDDGCTVLPIRTDGNMTGDYLQGQLAAHLAIARAFVRRDVPKEHKTVNVFAEKPSVTNTQRNFQAMRGFLARMGVRVNCRFLNDVTVDELRGFCAAELNIPAYGDYTARILGQLIEQEFGGRVFDRGFPIGFDETASWLRDVGAFFGAADEAEAIIAEQREVYRSQVEQLRAHLQGRKLMVVSYNCELDWILKTAIDAGMRIVRIGLLDYSQDAGFRTRLDVDLPVVEGYDRAAFADEVRSLAPDVLLTNYAVAQTEGVPVADVIPMCPDVGFLSSVALARRWVRLLRLGLEGGWKRDAALFG